MLSDARRQRHIVARYDFHWHCPRADFHRFRGLTVTGRIAASREPASRYCSRHPTKA
jgi:hypothetical protein